MMGSVVMATEPSDYQCFSQQLPQLPAFTDTQWLESTIQASDLELISSPGDTASTPFLLYVIHCCDTCLLIHSTRINFPIFSPDASGQLHNLTLTLSALLTVTLLTVTLLQVN